MVLGPSSGNEKPALRLSTRSEQVPSAITLPSLSLLEERGAADRLAGELADDLLEDVLHRHQSEDLAVLVDHESHVALVLLEVGELREERRALRHESRARA